MKLKSIIVATSNTNKVKEFADLLRPHGLAVQGLPASATLPAETGDSFLANARLKALYGYRLTGLATLADDSGLMVEALEGAPGVHSARYAGSGAGDAANNEKLLQALVGVKDRRACFHCAVLLVAADFTVVAEGSCPGIIAASPSGKAGFGYDPLFWLPTLGKTMAELSAAEKNAVSHRSRAIANLMAALRDRGLV